MARRPLRAAPQARPATAAGWRSPCRRETGQLFLTVTPAQHPCPPGGEQVPDRVADHVAVLCPDAEPLLAGEEEVWFGLGPAYLTSLDDHILGANAQEIEGGGGKWRWSAQCCRSGPVEGEAWEVWRCVESR
jgi:hypothetical protein